MDFENEVRNAEKTRKNFRTDDDVYIPYVYKKYSNKRTITMELVSGIRIDDIP